MNNNWQTKKLGEVATVISGQSPNGLFYNTEGKGLPFYQGKREFTDKFIGKPTMWTTEITKEAYEGDVLMSVRAPVGPVNFATQKICIGRGLAAIRVSQLLDRDYLFYYLKFIENKISGSSGAVFPSINKKQIEGIELSFPSVAEQRNIVKKLDELSKKIKKLEEHNHQKLILLAELKKSISAKAFIGEL